MQPIPEVMNFIYITILIFILSLKVKIRKRWHSNHLKFICSQIRYLILINNK